MLLNNLNRIMDLDNQIDEMHRALAALYEERSQLVSNEQPSKKSKAKTATKKSTQTIPAAKGKAASWERQCYTRLQMDWAAHDVVIPSFTKLQTKLRKAKHVMDKLAKHDDALSVILMPPASIVNFDHPIITDAPIEFSSAVSQQAGRGRSWKVYVVSTRPGGYPLDDPTADIISGGFTMADYDVPGLDIREYAIFAALQTPSVDHDSWSVLAREADAETGQVPCVAFIGGKYQFEIDNTDALIGDNHFRPAMEIGD